MENYAILKCPYCGEVQIVDIPKEKCLTFLVCKFCNKLITTPKGADCVICAYSDKKCPVSVSKKQFKKDVLVMLIIVGVVVAGFYFWQSPFYKNNYQKQINTTTQEQKKNLTALVLPKDGDLFIDDIYFNEDGYKKLLVIGQAVGADKDLYENKLAGLDVWIPCCDFRYMATDPSQNCQCGHHVALYGAAKFLALKNLPKADIQKGIDKWRAYFFPQEVDKFQSNNSRGNC